MHMRGSTAIAECKRYTEYRLQGSSVFAVRSTVLLAIDLKNIHLYPSPSRTLPPTTSQLFVQRVLSVYVSNKLGHLPKNAAVSALASYHRRRCQKSWP